MAIIRPQEVVPRLAEIGRIFKGSKKTGNRPGTDLDHFRFEPSEGTFDSPSPSGTGSLAQYLIEQFAELGDSPRNIAIRFLQSDPKQIFQTSNEVWATVSGRSRCVRRCDGVTQLLHLTEDKKLSREPLSCLAGIDDNKCPKGCKPTGRLFFIMPGLKHPGQIVLTTHSINDIVGLQRDLAAYESWDLSKIPFRLCRTKKVVPFTPEDGQTKYTDRWLLHLEIDPAFGNAVLEAQPQRYLSQIQGSDEPIEVDVIESVALPPAEDIAKEEVRVNPSLISDKQANRLYAIAKGAGYTDEGLKAMVAKSGFSSSKDITRAAYEQLCEAAGDEELSKQWNKKA